MKNNKGFAISSIVYSMLILFLGLILLILGNLANRKAIFDKEKNDILSRFSDEIICKPVVTSTTGNIPQGNFAYGDEYTCELGDNDSKTFFVLETDGDNVSLIMNANIDSNGKAITPTNIPTDKGYVAWCSDEIKCKVNNNWNNSNGPLTANAYLLSSTKKWTKLNNSQVTLPTANQIATASEKTFNNNDVYSLSTWLYDYLDSTNNSISGISAYWTASSNDITSSYAWLVYNNGAMLNGSLFTSGGIGIRPVITIPKDKIYVEEKTYLCNSVSTATTGNVSSGNYTYGDEYTCELGDNDSKTFFVLETDGDNVSLIMDRNIDSNGKGTTSGNTVAWVTKEDYIDAGGIESDWDYYGNSNFGPITAQKHLKNSTTSWTKLTESQINLPTGQQIATAGGDSAWTDSNYTGAKLSTWLYGNLSSDEGYWTSTPDASFSFNVWYVYYGGYLHYDVIGTGIDYGIRPVITVPKSELK